MRGTRGVNEKDWKLFRSRIPDWQEAYMDRLNHEYIELLSGEGNPSDKFWALEERIRQDKKGSGVQTEMSRSNMKFILMDLLDEVQLLQQIWMDSVMICGIRCSLT